MTLSRVVTAVWFKYLRAKEEADRLWSDFELLSDYEKAVKNEQITTIEAGTDNEPRPRNDFRSIQGLLGQGDS